jgi:hypothetical protein
VVPTNSQIGGLNDYTFIPDVMHSSSTENFSVKNILRLLLDQNPANSIYFDGNVGGYDPHVILPTSSPASTPSIGEPSLSTLPSVGTGIVNITNPTLGFICSEGETIQIDVSSAPNVSHLVVTVNNANTGTKLFDSLVNSATFYYTVPYNIAGSIRIAAMGYDTSGFVGSDTLDVFATPATPLDSLTFFTDNIYIQKGQSVALTLNGYFHDSTLRDISQLSGISYSVINPNIATLDAGNALHGLAVGTTILHASYQDKHVYCLVTVYMLNQQLSDINLPNGSTNCYDATQTITIAGNGTEFNVQDGASATLIAGQQIIFMPGTKVFQGGYLHGYITNTGQYCESVLPSSLPIGNVTITDGQDYCFDAAQSISTGGNGNTFAVQSGGNVHLIAGQTIQMYPTTIASTGSKLHAYISTNGAFCNNPSSLVTSNNEETKIKPSLDTDFTSNSFFKVYPNPTTGNFILEITGEIPNKKLKVDVYGMWGEKLFTQELNGEKKHEFSLSSRPAGIYFIRVITGGHLNTTKLIKL